MTAEELANRFLFPYPDFLTKSDLALVTIVRVNEKMAGQQVDGTSESPRDEEIDYARDLVEQCISILHDRNVTLPAKLAHRLESLNL
jgi:hypothetical protein